MSIKLREVVITDLEMIRKWRTLPEVTKFMYTTPKLTMEDQLKWFDKISNSKTEKYWIIQLDDTLDVGLLSINNIDKINSQCSWAYYIADMSARGRGLAKILECNIYDYVFDYLNLNKLWCEVFKFNDMVISLHQKFGSEIEGEFQEHIYKENEFHDVVRMAILKKKWQDIKNNFEYKEIVIEGYIK